MNLSPSKTWQTGLNRSDIDITILICKHLCQESSEAENLRLKHWLGKSAENQNHYNEIRLIFDHMSDLKGLHRFDEGAAWNKFTSALKKR